MSEFKRLGDIGRAYWNRGVDELDRMLGGTPESDARKELDEALHQPLPTVGGQVLNTPESQQPSTGSTTPIVSGNSWAYKALGLTQSASLDEIEAAFKERDKRLNGLVRTCTKRLKEADDDESRERFAEAKAEAKELRAKLKQAYVAILAERDTVFQRFHDLEIEPDAKQKGETLSDLEKSTVERFKNLELD